MTRMVIPTILALFLIDAGMQGALQAAPSPTPMPPHARVPYTDAPYCLAINPCNPSELWDELKRYDSELPEPLNPIAMIESKVNDDIACIDDDACGCELSSPNQLSQAPTLDLPESR